jgi:hypothetical protein
MHIVCALGVDFVGELCFCFVASLATAEQHIPHTPQEVTVGFTGSSAHRCSCANISIFSICRPTSGDKRNEVVDDGSMGDNSEIFRTDAVAHFYCNRMSCP